MIPHDQVIGSPEPAILHLRIGLLGKGGVLDEGRFTRTQVPLSGAATIAIGADADAVVAIGLNAIVC